MQPRRYEERSPTAVAVMLTGPDPVSRTELTLTENISGWGCGIAEVICAFGVDSGRITGNSEAKDIVRESSGEAAITREVIQRIQEDGTCWCGGTEWQGKTAMQISVWSWTTTEEDVDRSVKAMVRIARAYEA